MLYPINARAIIFRLHLNVKKKRLELVYSKNLKGLGELGLKIS